jgi:hypothetical protein
VSALDFDPFQGDFGTPGDRTLSDRMVKARKQHECCHCRGPILKGEQHRGRTDIADGELMSWRWCAACCAAMLAEMDGEDESYPFEARAHVEPTKKEPQ